MNSLLSQIAFSGRYYKTNSREIAKLEKQGLIKIEKDNTSSWAAATEKGLSRCSANNLPTLPDLDELGLCMYNQIRLLAKNNRHTGYDEIWEGMLALYPGKYKTIREAVCYYMIINIKNRI